MLATGLQNASQSLMQRLLQDLRFAIRQLRKSPGFGITTIVTLALGIGATTSIFSLVNAVLLRPLPFPEQDRLVSLENLDVPSQGAAVPEHLSYPDFIDWRKQQHSFSGMASHRDNGATLSGAGDAQQLTSQVVSSDFFRVLGAHPMLGRDFSKEDEQPDTHVVMLSHQLWQSTFGGARDIVGRPITLDGQSYTVAGVMPPNFSFPIQNPPVALWTSMGDDKGFFSQRGADLLEVIGRLNPGVSLPKAKADIDVIVSGLGTEYPDTNKIHHSAIAQPVLEQLVGDTRPALRILFSAVGLVLLIACANVAGLLLARASRRRSDIALQAALGASPNEIIRQILVESVVLSMIAGAFGIAISLAAVRWLPDLVPDNLLPRIDQIGVDSTVLAFATAASVLTGLLFGVLPAWRMSRFDPLLALREGSRNMAGGRRQHRVQSWLLISETALGLVLLVGAGLLIRSFVRILNVDPGFDTHHVLTANLSVPSSRYKRAERIDFYHRLFTRLAALPGVESVSAGFPLPLSGNHIDISFTIEGRPIAQSDEPSEQMAVITPDFFRTMKIPILRGRAFNAADDTKGQPVIIINETFARKYFPGENPVGKRIQPGLGDGEVKSPMRQVVGVVGDVKAFGLTANVVPQYYLPWEQAVITSPALAIRSAQDPTTLIASVRAAVSDMDRQIPLYRAATLEQAFDRSAANPRFQTLLLASFAAMALLLCGIGLYGLLSYMVVQRSAEIGLRVALGAQRTDVLALIMGRGLSLAAAGVVIGLAASAFLTKYLTSILFNVPALDAVTFATVSVILLLVSLAASSVPAYRAARLDPMKTLRDQ
jgi:putative ABC transport system permease protein